MISTSRIPRKSYTSQYKLKVLDYADIKSNTEACERFNISPSMISRWRAKRDALSTSRKTCKRVGNSGRPVSYPDCERELYQWLLNERDLLHPVTYADLREKMLELTDKGFKASSGWLSGFMTRFSLSLRMITTTTSKQKTNDEISTLVKSFHEYLTSLKANNPTYRVVNVDQTPVWLNIGSSGHTVDLKGSKKVSGIIPPGNPKEKLTVILACDESGNKFPPAVIARSNRKKPRITLNNGVVVFNNPKTSMANSKIMSQWLKIMLGKESGKQGTILIMDSFRGHLTDEVKETCAANNISRAIIPGGLTGICQPLDLTVNRSFKAQLKQYYRRHGLRQERPLMVTKCAFNLSTFTKGVRYAWAKVRQGVIKNGFKAMYASGDENGECRGVLLGD